MSDNAIEMMEDWMNETAHDITGHTWMKCKGDDWGEIMMCLAGGGEHACFWEVRRYFDEVKMRLNYPCRKEVQTVEDAYIINSKDDRCEWVSFDRPPNMWKSGYTSVKLTNDTLTSLIEALATEEDKSKLFDEFIKNKAFKTNNKWWKKSPSHTHLINDCGDNSKLIVKLKDYDKSCNITFKIDDNAELMHVDNVYYIQKGSMMTNDYETWWSIEEPPDTTDTGYKMEMWGKSNMWWWLSVHKGY